MSWSWHTFRHAPLSLKILRQHLERHQVRRIADARAFQPGDLAILRSKLHRDAPPILTRPLKPERRIQSHKGVILHDDIIGKRVRDTIQTNVRDAKQAADFRLHAVKLEEYVRLSRRLVTPIYPADAEVIVGLLDLHPEPPPPNSDGEEAHEKLEILEAGTGHGALTLYLSRAIHGMNRLVPRLDDMEDEEGRGNAMEAWKASRRAVIHTIDCSTKFSSHARNVVQNFRRGMYLPNVDFYVTDVSAWVRKTLPEREHQPFLSHAFLDLPQADAHLANVAEALRTDGTLIVFNPNITQICECVMKIKQDAIPLELERVVELGVNGSSGGRDWTVKAVRPRKRSPVADRPTGDEQKAENGVIIEESGRNGDDLDSAESPASKDDLPEAKSDEGEWSMVCRPKVGERIVGGGFLGVWKKQRDMQR